MSKSMASHKTPKRSYVIWAIAIFPLFLWTCTVAAAAEEKINDYQSEIVVNQDGSLNVTETIRVTATGNKIKLGIYRDFPTRYPTELFPGIRNPFWDRVVPFKILAVLRDGKAEPYHTEKQNNGVRIYIGQKNVQLKPGPYTYQICYWTNFQLGYFADHDELYWNVTGNGWDFPILKASASVRLPAAVPLDQVTIKSYTGPQGSKEDNARSSVDKKEKRIRFETTGPLGVKEGLTIVVSFPKGIISKPSEADRSEIHFVPNVPVWIATGGCLILLTYYFVAWFLVGRDPPSRAIVPLYDPPENLSPACARYLWKMGYDRTCFTAAILNLACKGWITIKENEGKYTLRRTTGETKEKTSNGEKAVYGELLSGDSIVLKQANYQKVKSAIEALSTKLSEEFDGRLFFKHVAWLVPGWLFTPLVLGGIWFSGDSDQALAPVLAIWLTMWTFGCYTLGKKALLAWRAARTLRSGTAKAIGSYFGAVWATLFCIPFFGGEIVAFVLLFQMHSISVVALIVCLFGLHWIFWRLIKQPTEKGRGVMDAIEGFRMYLGPVEGEVLEKLNPPEKTPALFEKMLPYALALGVENSWAERFVDVLRAAATDPRSNYQPAWYVGSGWNSDNFGSFAGTLGSSLSTAISSSSTAPGSSSGSGGGGFSGGGGGGGGGGGW
ncbi:MAG: DUF2207 domain-containing protein [Pirellulales bacterium]|nr:DUF2207 domain-containing protein [Pirellulales bacterium]